MRRTMLVTALLVAPAMLGFGLAREQGNTKMPTDETAIRAVVDAFVKAFDKHDAVAIAALFLPDAKMILEDGTVVEGRKAIGEVFAAQFAESPDAKIVVNVESIKFVGTDLAIETGSTIVTPGPGQEPETNRYTVVHLKRDGKWMMALARDTEGESLTNNQRLQPLAWLVGDWIDESPSAVVMTSCRWSDDKNFLLQDVQVKTAGKATMTINQRLGWDPVHKSIRAWMFDSEGGFGESYWTRAGDDWVIKATGVRTDGSTASATNTIVRTSKDSYLWRSTDRIVDGNVTNPVEVRVVRKPPTAGSTKN